MAQVIQTPEQQLYLSRLLGYDYTIQYRASKSNMVEDALSRVYEPPTGTLLLLSTPHFAFLEELKKELIANSDFLVLRQVIQFIPDSHLNYSITQDFIMKNGRSWLPNGLPFIQTLLSEFHQSPTRGHMGVCKTLARLNDNFTWANIHQDVRKFIPSCLDCQHTKYETTCA